MTTLARTRRIASTIASAFSDAMEGNARLRTVRRLQALSDEQLAQRGLTRDGIVPHVFASYFHL